MPDISFWNKLINCKLYPGGANARQHPNALALKKGSLAAGARKENIKKHTSVEW